MQQPRRISRTLLGWILSIAFSMTVLALTPTLVSAQYCHFGSCSSPDSGSCPNYCGVHPQFQDSYYDPECYYANTGSLCYQYICWYLENSGTCSYPGDVCDNDDYYTCQYMGG
jgi:hypothetical protein